MSEQEGDVARSATHRARIGHRLLIKMGIRDSGHCPRFDEAHKKYTYLRHYVEDLQQTLSTYAVQVARTTEAARGMGADTSHLYGVKDAGFKPVTAFKDAQEQCHSGYAGQLQHAFVQGVLNPVGDWQRDLRGLEGKVSAFTSVQVQHDHYRIKVEDLKIKAQQLEARAATRGDSRNAKAAAERLNRNSAKLQEVTKHYNEARENSCQGMNEAWRNRLVRMNNIVSRLIHFQEAYLGEQLMIMLGVSRILEEAGGKQWGENTEIQAFVSRSDVRLYEGELIRKLRVMNERKWFRLVGSSLEVFDIKDKDDSYYVVTETPVVTHIVRGVQKVDETSFRVNLATGDVGLHLYAMDAADAEGWCKALEKASVWDQLTSTQEVERHITESRVFLDHCKAAYAGTTTVEILEDALGVTSAMSNPPTPPLEVPVSTEIKDEAAGGGASAAGGGGGEEAADKAAAAGGGPKAAGIAPGGENGPPAGTPPAAAPNGGGGGKKGKNKKKGKGEGDGGGGGGKGGKGGGDANEKVPDLLDTTSKIGLGVGLGLGMGAFPAGMTGGGVPGGGGGPRASGRMGKTMSMMGSSPAGFGGPMRGYSGHSSMGGPSSAYAGPSPSMGDPRLGIPLGGGPPMPSMHSSLLPGMTQSGPPVMMPPGMVPPGSAPVIDPIAPGPQPPHGMMGGPGGPPMMGGPGGPPMMGGPGGPPMMGGPGGAPMMGGHGAPPMMGGHGGSPMMGGHGGSPMMGGHGGSPMMGGRSPTWGPPNMSGAGRGGGWNMGNHQFVPKFGSMGGAEKQQRFRRSHSVGAGIPDQMHQGFGGNYPREYNPPYDDMMIPPRRQLYTTPEAEWEAADDDTTSTRSAPAVSKKSAPPASKKSASSFGASAAVGAATAMAEEASAAAAEAAEGGGRKKSARNADEETKAEEADGDDVVPTYVTAPAQAPQPKPQPQVYVRAAATPRKLHPVATTLPTKLPTPKFSTRSFSASSTPRPSPTPTVKTSEDKRIAAISKAATAAAAAAAVTAVAAATRKSAAAPSIPPEASDVPSETRVEPTLELAPAQAPVTETQTPGRTRISSFPKPGSAWKALKKMAATGSTPSPVASGAESKGTTPRAGKDERLQGVSPASGSGSAAGSASSRSDRWPLKRSKSSTKGGSPVPPTPAPPAAPDQAANVAAEGKKMLETSASTPRESKPESPSPTHDGSGPGQPPNEAIMTSSPSTISAEAEAKVLAAMKRVSRPPDTTTAAPESTTEDAASPTNAVNDTERTVGGEAAGDEKAGMVAPPPSVSVRDAVAAAEARRVKERAESEEAARRVDTSTGMMKGFTLADLIERRNAFEGGGSSNFDITVSGSRAAAASVVETPAVDTSSKEDSDDTADKHFQAAAAALNLVGSSPASSDSPARSVPSASASNERRLAVFKSLSGPSSTGGAKSSSKKSDSIADVSSARASANSLASSKLCSSSSSGGGGGSRGYETPGSDAKAADQVKVFRRLCVAKTPGASEAESGDAGAGVAAQRAAGRSAEQKLTFDQLMAWDEVQELLDYGSLKEAEVSGIFKEAVRTQGWENVGSSAKTADLWALPGTNKDSRRAMIRAGSGSTDGRSDDEDARPKDALTQKGFMNLVKLIEELQFEKELEQDKGVGLIPGPVYVL